MTAYFVIFANTIKSPTMKTIRTIITLLLLAASCLSSSAFDWKPQSNEELRSDMLSFAKSFEAQAKGTKAAKILKKFIKNEERIAAEQPYAWIADTYETACRIAALYEPATVNGKEESTAAMIRKNAFMLLDYPIHVDNLGKNRPIKEKEAFDAATGKYLADARAKALKWLEQPAPAKGELSMFKIYNMGFIFRTSERTFAIDLRWDGTREEADKIAKAIDVMFLTHPHLDHYSPLMLEALRDAGTMMVLPCDLLPDFNGYNKIVFNEDIMRAKDFKGVKVISLKGMQDSPSIPNNTYIFDFDGWRIIDNGDNSVRESEARVSQFPAVDVIIAACWNKTHNIIGNAMKVPGAETNPPLYLPAHQNEILHHGVNHRESFHELFNRKDRLGDPDFNYPPYVIIDNGESLTLKK